MNLFILNDVSSFFFSAAEGDINDVLIKTLSEAHLNTNVKLEVVHEMFRKQQVSNTFSELKEKWL